MTNPVSRRVQRRTHMLMWAMLTQSFDSQRSHWIFLLEWARLGGKTQEVRHG